eukprot:c13665_g1_i1.p1 GENE.c13665_g1_i1~~c13665_g1_i1.p1  ORF type:complete len:336 (+),score=106.88 c13665_g1_i1:3-1010(+)
MTSVFKSSASRIVLFCVLITCFLIAIECDKSKKKDVLNQRIKENPLLKMSPKEYERFVVSGPRSYTTIVLIYEHGNPQFEMLGALEGSLSFVAMSYDKWFQNSHGSEEERPVVFVSYDAARDAEVLRKHGIGMVASLFVIPSTTDTAKKYYTVNMQTQTYDLRSEWTVPNVHAWVKKQLRVDFPLYVDPLEVITTYSAYVISGILVFSIVRFLFKNFVGPNHPIFWFFICAAVWIVVAGGTHFCILRQVPWTMSNPRTGEVQYFHPRNNAQLFAEGYIMTASQFGTSMVLVTLSTVYPTMKNGYLKRLFGYLLVALLLGGLYWVRLRHAMKYGWA